MKKKEDDTLSYKKASVDTPQHDERSRLESSFEFILSSLVQDDSIFERPIVEGLSKLLTYDYRLPLHVGLESLNDLEQKIFECAQEFNGLIHRESPSTEFSGCVIRIFYNKLGRLHFREVTSSLPLYPEGIESQEVGFICLPRSTYEQLEKSVQSEIVREKQLRSEIDVLLSKIEHAGQLTWVLDVVDDAVRHVEAVYIYFDDELWSVMEKCTTLINRRRSGPGIITQLRGKSVQDWTATQRLGIASLYALFLSGRSVRFEEFNGKLLTARALLARLQSLGEQYGEGETIDATTCLNLFDLAESIGQASKKSIGQSWVRYREINGLTYFKTEKVVGKSELSPSAKMIPERIIRLYETWLDKPFDYESGYEKVFADLVDICVLGQTQVKNTADNPAKSPIEVIIQEVVTAAVIATQSDYGMSSSIRNPSILLAEKHGLVLQNMLRLQPKDFFTCIVSRAGLESELGERLYTDVYSAVQARMQYNRWHFIAGNFERDEVPENRHYFYPPVLPDIAEWSDQRHGGHIQGGVRYSIRAPGPDMGQQPLMIGDQAYRGFYDVRVVRMDGTPYTLQDMLLTRHCNLWMGVVWRRIVDHCEKHLGIIEIHGFEKGNGYSTDALCDVELFVNC